LNLASNGIDALRAIGADRGVLDAAFPTPRMVMWSGSGKRLGEVANGIALDDGTTSQTVQRGLLHRALREEASSRGIPIVRGKRLVAAEARGSGVFAAFEDGTGVSAAMLVGADGLHSVSRRLIDRQAPSPHYTGLLSLGGRGVTRTIEPTPDTFHMIFGKRGFFGFTVRPSGEVYWFANLASAELPAGGSAAIGSRSGRSGCWLSSPATRPGGGDHQARRRMTSRRIHFSRCRRCDGAPERWSSSGRGTRHVAQLGQGASLAIEMPSSSRNVFATCDVGDAFAIYEQLRRRRVERVVRYSARIGRTKSPGPIRAGSATCACPPRSRSSRARRRTRGCNATTLIGTSAFACSQEVLRHEHGNDGAATGRLGAHAQNRKWCHGPGWPPMRPSRRACRCPTDVKVSIASTIGVFVRFVPARRLIGGHRCRNRKQDMPHEVARSCISSIRVDGQFTARSDTR
jgi:hypothetical protein